MAQVIAFGQDDLARTRFTVSPLWEVMSALRVLVEPQRPNTTCRGWTRSGRIWTGLTWHRCCCCRRATGGHPTSSAPYPTARTPPSTTSWRGYAELWQPARTPRSGALARLLGRTRAALLESLAEPASTHTLASRHGFAPSTVSEHLAALHDAGLVIRRRHRHAVLYQRTPLGTELAAGSS